MTSDTAQDQLNSPTQSNSPRSPIIPTILSRSFSGRRSRSHSISAGDFPPPLRRSSTEASARPVPFATKFQRVHPATTGVAVLAHMEQLDKVEANLQRLGAEIPTLDEEEADVGESTSSANLVLAAETSISASPPALLHHSLTLPPVQERSAAEEAGDQDDPELDEEDLAALSKSTGHLETRMHGRWTSHQNERHPGLDWIATGGEEAPKIRTVVVEVTTSLELFSVTLISLQRLETIEVKPLCSCW